MSKIDLDKIRIDGGTQPRAKINQDVVDEYAELYRAGAKLPPVVAFHDGAEWWLGDGFHRYHGRRKAEKTDIEVEERKGTVEDARWFAYATNQTHGMRRTNADKEKAVKAALSHPKAAAMTDRQIADYLGVSHHTVEKYRPTEGAVGQMPNRKRRRTGKGGGKYKAKKPPKTPPKPDPEGDQISNAVKAAERSEWVEKLEAAAKAGKCSATQGELAKFAEFEEDVQEAMFTAIVAGRQTVANAISTGCPADPTIEDIIAAKSKAIESACRALKAAWEEHVEPLDDPWLDDGARKSTALQKLDNALTLLRSAKCVEACPKCKGDGCATCHKTGRVPRNLLQQLK